MRSIAHFIPSYGDIPGFSVKGGGPSYSENRILVAEKREPNKRAPFLFGKSDIAAVGLRITKIQHLSHILK